MGHSVMGYHKYIISIKAIMWGLNLGNTIFSDSCIVPHPINISGASWLLSSYFDVCHPYVMRETCTTLGKGICLFFFISTIHCSWGTKLGLKTVHVTLRLWDKYFALSLQSLHAWITLLSGQWNVFHTVGLQNLDRIHMHWLRKFVAT